MARKRFKPEEIVAKLRQVEVLQSQGMAAADAIRQIGVTEVTYYRWRKEYGGMRPLKWCRNSLLPELQTSLKSGSVRVASVRRASRAVLVIHSYQQSLNVPTLLTD